MYKSPNDDATTSFLSSVTTPRGIGKPIEVQSERDKKEKPHTADEYEIIYNPETDQDHPYEKWRRNRILKFMVTREIARYLDRRTFITVSIRECFIYIIFLILLTIITFGTVPIDMFYFSQAMATLYTKQSFPNEYGEPMLFYDVNKLDDIWRYELSIVDKLYHSFWYSKPNPYENPEQGEEYYYENRLMGIPQIRQARVANNTCTTSDQMKHLIYSCYGPYSSANEGTEQLGEGCGDYCVYKTAKQTTSMSITGSLATYGGGGYVAGLAKNSKVEPTQVIQRLKHNKWLDKGTRAVFTEFTIYNGNVNLFCIFKIIFEIPPTGGVIPSHWNYVQKLIRYNDSYDFFILACEILMTIFFVFYTIQKLMEIVTLKTKIFSTFWFWIDLIVLVMCYLVVIFNAVLYFVVNDQIPKVIREESRAEPAYTSFDDMCYIHILYSYSFAILIAFAFFRLLKYLNIVYTMYQLQSTISRATKDILSYCVIFFYLYFVFALVGLFLFGSKLEDYKTFPMAVFALMRSTVGDFNYHKLEEANPVSGPIFFFAFIFFVSFILANIFLAILVSKYEEVRSEVRIGGVKTFIGDVFKSWFIRTLEKAECHWLLSQIERKSFEKKVRSPTEAIRQYLRQAGYSELEIELFFKKYDITDSKISAMDEERLSFRQGEREAPPPLTQKDIMRYIVIQKLEYLENHYQAANKLIDEFLNKLKKFEGRR